MRAVRSYRTQHASAIAVVAIPSERTRVSTSDQIAVGLSWDFHELLDYGSGSAGFWVTYLTR